MKYIYLITAVCCMANSMHAAHDAKHTQAQLAAMTTIGASAGAAQKTANTNVLAATQSPKVPHRYKPRATAWQRSQKIQKKEPSAQAKQEQASSNKIVTEQEMEKLFSQYYKPKKNTYSMNYDEMREDDYAKVLIWNALYNQGYRVSGYEIYPYHSDKNNHNAPSNSASINKCHLCDIDSWHLALRHERRSSW